MMKYTPGPWFADKLDDRCAFNVFPHGATFALLTVAPPAHDGAHPYGLAAEANARLIAAAPELLEALLAAVEHFERVDASEESRKVIDRACAAIAKATRRSA